MKLILFLNNDIIHTQKEIYGNYYYFSFFKVYVLIEILYYGGGETKQLML